MKSKIERVTVDLSAYPDLVVIYLGIRAQSWRGLSTIMKLGPQIKQSVAEKPDGLLLHEGMMFSLWPLHVGMRQYWRDFQALEQWTRTMPHRGWWQSFLQDAGGTDFWHETYFMRGGMEAIYLDAKTPVGFAQFAPLQTARGPMFSSRQRAARQEASELVAPVPETELYL
ncbi:MAG: DUF4188 domain-containing protein [Blastocatellia bacterium]